MEEVTSTPAKFNPDHLSDLHCLLTNHLSSTSAGAKTRKAKQSLSVSVMIPALRVEAEMGPNYERRMNREGTDVDPAKFAMAAPVFNFETGSVQVMSLTQKGLIREMDKLSQLEDYKDILDWDFVMETEGAGLNTTYSLRIVPRKKATESAILDAWAAARDAGFDINRLMTGGNPFKRD